MQKVFHLTLFIVLLTSQVFAGEHFPDPCDDTLSPNVLPRHPLATLEFVYTRGYEGGFRTTHKGIDIATAPGNPIVAVWDGVITTIKWDNGVVGRSAEGGVGFGYYLIISNHHGTYSFYGHLLPNSVPLKEGAAVTAGMVIALSGNSGKSSGPHLHYAEKNLQDKWIDATWVIQTAHNNQYLKYPENKFPAFLMDEVETQLTSYCESIKGSRGLIPKSSSKNIVVNKTKTKPETQSKQKVTAKNTTDRNNDSEKSKNNVIIFEEFLDQKNENPYSRLWRPEGIVIKE